MCDSDNHSTIHNGNNESHNNNNNNTEDQEEDEAQTSHGPAHERGRHLVQTSRIQASENRSKVACYLVKNVRDSEYLFIYHLEH